MTVDERRRIQLFERLATLLGQEHAATMLEMLPPAGQDVLTREDLQRELDRALAELRQDLAQLAQDQATVRQDLAQLAQSQAHFNQDLAHYATKADLYRIFTAQTIALAAVLGAAAAFFG